jgi:hypothetical protein
MYSLYRRIVFIYVFRPVFMNYVTSLPVTWIILLLLLLLLLLWLQPFVGPWPLFKFLDPTQSVGLLERGISPSQSLNLHTEQHKHRINAHNTAIHALTGNRTHDPGLRASEDSSCLRPHGHCDRQLELYRMEYYDSWVINLKECSGKQS